MKTPLFPMAQIVLQAEIQVETVEAMQELRNAILNHNFEISLNQELLARQHGRLQLCVNKTHFCESYEQQLLSISKLTRHQTEKYKEIKETGKLSTAVHLSSVAGAGKTFLAVELMIDTVKQNSSGQVLFVAPSASLSLHFLRWLGRRAAREKFDFEGLLNRVLVMIPPYKCLMKCCIKDDNSMDLMTLPASQRSSKTVIASTSY